MSLDAGEIKGRLNLDTTEFNHGFQEAHTHAETEGGRIREVLESIAEVASEVAGPAFAQFGQQLQSAFAGFSEGPVIGGLNLMGIAAGAVRESVADLGGEFRNVALEAQKAGVSVEFMDRFSNVASTTGVGLEQLSQGFRILEQRAVEATEQGGKAQEAFERIGISMSELTRLMEQPEELFTRVQTAIGGMTSSMNRLGAAHDLMSRQGANLVPVLSLSKKQFDTLAETLDRLKGGMDDQTSAMGYSLNLLEGYFKAAMDGISRAVGQPVLQFLLDHMGEIEPKIESYANAIKSGIGKAWEFLAEQAKELMPTLQDVLHGVEDGAGGFDYMAKAIESGLLPVLKAVAPLVSPLLKLFMDLAKVDFALVIGFLQAIKPILDGIVKALEAIIKTIDELLGRLVTVIGQFERFQKDINGDPNKSWFYHNLANGDDPTKPSNLQDALNYRAAQQRQAAEAARLGVPVNQVPIKISAHTLSNDEIRAELNIAGAVVKPDETAKAADATAKAMAAVAPALDNLTAQINSMIDDTFLFGRSDFFEANAGAGGGSGGASSRVGGGGSGAAGSGTVINNNISVQAPDSNESGRQFAARALPIIRDAQRRAADDAAGAAAVRLAEMSMGGWF